MTGDTPMDPARLDALLGFLARAGGLKDTLRSGFTAAGRSESTAEHSWRLALLAILLEDDLPGIDLLKLVKLCLIHDLGEVISGDTPAPLQAADDGRAARERRDMAGLCDGLPADRAAALMALWDDYTGAASPEAVLAKGLDKIETVLTHAAGGNPADFDYGFNLGYARGATDRHPLLTQIRAAADAATRARMTGDTPR